MKSNESEGPIKVLKFESCTNKLSCGQFCRASNIYDFQCGEHSTFDWIHVQGHIQWDGNWALCGIHKRRTEVRTTRIPCWCQTKSLQLEQNHLVLNTFRYGLHLWLNAVWHWHHEVARSNQPFTVKGTLGEIILEAL